MLKGRNIVLGVSGGIAAYKSCELVRLLKKRGAHVAVVMTRSATRLVQPLTFQILSENPVLTNLWKTPSLALDFEPREGLPAGPVGHVDLGAFADAVLVAPATANILAKAAHGMADDALSTVLVAARKQLIFAPTMNVNMWNAPAVQENLDTLRRRGAHVLEPGEGMLACGWEGKGRMPEPEEIVEHLVRCLGGDLDTHRGASGAIPFSSAAGAATGSNAPLRGRTIVISAGPTEEPIDAVRYISNRSSGKMGYALAGEAARLGARTILVSGPVSLPTPPGVERVDVMTAAEMEKAVMERSAGADAVIMSAAVADYRPAEPDPGKIKRSGPRTMELLPNNDILAALGRQKNGRFLVGFALEVESCMANAETKLREKQADMIVLNNPMAPGSAFGGDTNKVTILETGKPSEPWPQMTKREVAEKLLRRVAERLGAVKTPA